MRNPYDNGPGTVDTPEDRIRAEHAMEYHDAQYPQCLARDLATELARQVAAGGVSSEEAIMAFLKILETVYGGPSDKNK